VGSDAVCPTPPFRSNGTAKSTYTAFGLGRETSASEYNVAR
jgi:hypothetical protein